MRAQRKLVSFIGLGSASAASLLYSYIKMHPNICVPEEETEFFSSAKAFQKGIVWYESHFTKCGSEYTYGELSSNYLQNAQTAAIIARTYPSAKLLTVVENPLLSVRVAYVEARRARIISPRISLAMFLKQNPDVLLGARYGRQLTQYVSYYSPNDLLIVTADDVREDPLAVIKQTYEHIGVVSTFIPPILQSLIPEEENEVKKRPGIIKRTFKMIKRILQNLFRMVSEKIHPPVVPLENVSVVARQIPLLPELEEFLRNYYRQDVARLSEILHRNLGVEWGIEKDEEEVKN